MKSIIGKFEQKINENYVGTKSNLSPSKKFQKTRLDEMRRTNSPLAQKAVSRKSEKKKINERLRRQYCEFSNKFSDEAELKKEKSVDYDVLRNRKEIKKKLQRTMWDFWGPEK